MSVNSPCKRNDGVSRLDLLNRSRAYHLVRKLDPIAHKLVNCVENPLFLLKP